MILILIITHIVAVAAGAVIYAKYGAKALEFEQGQIILITQKIEAIKAKDLKKYNQLIDEWKAFVATKTTDFANLSSDLKTIVTSVK